MKVLPNPGQKGHKPGKNFVNKNDIKCKWCREEKATAAAHVIGAAHVKQAISAIEDRTLYIGELVPNDYTLQMSASVIAGITCPTCDTYIANEYEIKKDWRETQITLWKIAAALYFMQFEDPNSKVSVSPIVTTSEEPTPLTKKEFKRIMKHLKKGLRTNKEVFHTMDLKKNSLGWGIQQTEGTRILKPFGNYTMVISANEPVYRYIYFHTETKLHYLATNLKKFDSYTTEMEQRQHNILNNLLDQ